MKGIKRWLFSHEISLFAKLLSKTLHEEEFDVDVTYHHGEINAKVYTPRDGLRYAHLKQKTYIR